MAHTRLLAGVATALTAAALWGYQDAERIRGMESAGEGMAARAALAEQAQNHPTDVAALTAYAEFLDRHGDSETQAAYRRLLDALVATGNASRQADVARRLARLDLINGEREAAARDMDAYAKASGKKLPAGDPAAPDDHWPTAQIPGPIRSFARMAAVPPDSAPGDILPALARNVMTGGYQTGRGSETFEPTEYLKLVFRYLSQARELQALAGADHMIRVPKCESANVADLLRVLGYRMRGGCGSEVVLETVNAGRAFITSDSGFPINSLEQALRNDRPFDYDFTPTSIPVVFGTDYWTAGNKESASFVETLIGDPGLCRLYLAFAKLDNETADSLKTAIPFARLKTYAHVLDFYGGMFAIRGGKAVTPGGARSASAWADLAGASPEQGPQFFAALIAKDDGWLASFFDSLARIQGPSQEYLTQPGRMKRFYDAIRGKVTTPGPARPVLRGNADMMLLTSRLRIDGTGAPHIPGDLNIWKRLFAQSALGKYDARLSRQAASWKDPDDLLEALFALCRKDVENQPLKIFMALSDLDRDRNAPLDTATVERLVRDYPTFKAQYAVFSETPALTGKSMMAFLDSAEGLDKIRDSALRADATGVFQSAVSIWQILVRQGNIPDDRADAVFAALLGQFGRLANEQAVFDAGTKSLTALLAAAHTSEDPAEHPQEALLDLLGGPAGAETRGALSDALDSQRVASLDALYQISDRIEAMLKGQKFDAASVVKLTAPISEIELPRPALSTAEKLALPEQSTVDAHLDAERNFHPRTAIQRAGGDPARLREIRGSLAPWMRDTLMAFNYAYYAPPKAQVLYTNPLYVRNHDFAGPQGDDASWHATQPGEAGWPNNEGGRQVGSLSGLAYSLAEAEQNFLVPTHTQALIWTDLVPQIIVSATLPRWSNVTPNQLHWVALNLQYARELLAESVFEADVRALTLKDVEGMASPARAHEVSIALDRGDVAAAARILTPSELFALARGMEAAGKDQDSAVAAGIKDLERRAPREVSYAAISRAFGTPKPVLTNSYRPGLLNLRTFPTLMGYSSRIMAESWESNTLYWAALADELYLPPAELNVKIPEWTGSLVEHIFAANLDDWPAVLRSLRTVGADERAHARQQQASLDGAPNR